MDLVEEKLIERVKEKDISAFEQLFNQYKQKVYNSAYLILRNQELAKDVVQEAFIKIFTKIDELKENSHFEVWLYKIIYNSAVSALRKEQKLKRLTNVTKEHQFFSLSPISGNPQNITIREETDAYIMDCIHKLDVKHKTTLILFYYDEMSIREISEVMSCSEGTVKSRLFNGKKALKKLLCGRYGSDTMFDEGGSVYEFR